MLEACFREKFKKMKVDLGLNKVQKYLVSKVAASCPSFSEFMPNVLFKKQTTNCSHLDSTFMSLLLNGNLKKKKKKTAIMHITSLEESL